MKRWLVILAIPVIMLVAAFMEIVLGESNSRGGR